MRFVLLVCVKSFRKKIKKFKIALMTSFTLLNVSRNILLRARIDILERFPLIFCSFIETFIGVSYILLSSEKTQENKYIVLKFFFFFKLYGWRPL